MAELKDPRHEALKEVLEEIRQEKGYSLQKEFISELEKAGIKKSSAKKYIRGIQYPEEINIGLLNKFLGEDIEKRIHLKINKLKPLASVSFMPFGPGPDTSRTNDIFDEIKGKYAYLYSIASATQGDYISKNILTVDEFVAEHNMLKGTYISSKNEEMKMEMYIDRDENTFYGLSFDSTGRIYVIFMLHGLQVSGTRRFFYGMSIGEADEPTQIFATKILLVPETEKSGELPRRLKRSSLADEIWSPLYIYFWSQGVSAPYTHTEPRWRIRSKGDDGVERSREVLLRVLIEEMLEHW